MAQLMTMGFEPERITQAPHAPPRPRVGDLVPHRLARAAAAAARAVDRHARRAAGGAAPPPPGAPAVGDLLGDLLDLSVAPAPARRRRRRAVAAAAGPPPAAAPPTPPAPAAANSLDALLGTPQGPPPPAAAAPPSGGSGGGLSADVFAALAAPPVSVPAAVAAPLIPTPAAAPAAAPSPPAAAAVLAAPPAAAAPAAALPAGWVSKVEPSNGEDLLLQLRDAAQPVGTADAAAAAAAAASPATPPAAGAAAAAALRLPAQSYRNAAQRRQVGAVRAARLRVICVHRLLLQRVADACDAVAGILPPPLPHHHRAPLRTAAMGSTAPGVQFRSRGMSAALSAKGGVCRSPSGACGTRHWSGVICK